MTKRSKKEVCLHYLKMYADKDIEGIASLFSDNITLRDWKIKVLGKELALHETPKKDIPIEDMEIQMEAFMYGDF